MKKITLLIFLLHVLLTGFAQNKLMISGEIKDETGQPLPGAGILLGDYRLGTVADNAGRFQLRVGPGNYNVLVQMIGYSTVMANVIVEDKSVVVNIVLKESIGQLKEVVIRPDRRTSKWITTFTESFVGITPNARKCKIINPQVLRFEYNDDRKILTATSDDFLVIENKALGYRIKYLLKYFQKDEATGLVFFYGFPTFEDLKGTPAQIRDYAAKRAQAYKGSPEHFFSALYKNALQSEGFTVKNLVKKKNPEYVAPPAVDENIERASKKIADDKGRYFSDVLTILENKKRQTDSIEVISRGEFRITELLQQKTENLKSIRFDGALYVVYTKEGESNSYATSGYSIARPEEYNRYQVSVVNHANRELSFYGDGRIFDPASIVVEGYMAYERIADMVPRDFLVTDY
ncbi:MAG: carboxypeptidase-like regulatory domain-containing protein [Bacteroidota bacterium]